MKVTCDRAALAEGMGVVGTIASSRSPRPVLQCVKIEAKPDELILSATDLEVGVHYHIKQIQTAQPGQILLPAERIGPVIRESVDATVELELENDICHVRGRDSHYRLNSQPAGDFPEMADGDGEPSLRIQAANLRILIRRTAYAAARETTRYAINGVLWERSGKKLQMVATDGRRLAYAWAPAEADTDETLSAIVPIKAMHLIERMLVDPDEMVGVRFTENRLVVSTALAVVVTMLVEGHFPKYDDVIPKDATRKAQFVTAQLLSAVRRASLLTNEDSKGVRVSLSPGSLVLASRTPEHGEATVTMEAGYEGDPIDVGFNPHFLMDALKVVDDETLSLHLSEPNRPAVLRVESNFLYVIMPVSLS